jgi:hypothetical protein
MIKYIVKNLQSRIKWMKENPNTFITLKSKFGWIFYSFFIGHGSSARAMFFVPLYEVDEKDTIKLWYKVLLALNVCFSKIGDVKRWFYYRFKCSHQFHLVDTKLEPGYYDQYYRMLYACFALLVDYYNEAKDIVSIDDKVEELYQWWTVDRPASLKQEDELRHKVFGNRRIQTKSIPNSDLLEFVPTKFSDEEESLYKQYVALKEKNENADQTMLHKLIDVRETLWV